MLKKIVDLLDNQINYIDTIKNELMKEKGDIKVLESILDDVYKIKVIMGLAEDYMDIDELLEFQNYLFEKIIEQLSKELNYIGNLKYVFDKEVYPSAIEILAIDKELNNTSLLILDVYNKFAYIVPNEKISKLEKDIIELDEKIEELKKKIEKQELYIKNPILSGEDNPILTAKIMFTKKRTTKNLNKDLILLDEEMNILNKTNLEKNVLLQKLKNENIEFDLYKEKIISKLEKKYNYEIKKIIE